MNKEAVETFYDILQHEKQTEIRALKLASDLKTVIDRKQIFVNSKEEFVKIISTLDGQYNLYAGLNERIENGTEKKDVISVKTIFQDIDCIHKPASAEDLLKAEAVADNILNDLEQQTGVRGCKIYSGNGYQLLFKIPKIDITDANRVEIDNKIQVFTRELIAKYSTDTIKLDNVGDLPRIARITGTKNMKGGSESKFVEVNIVDNPKLRDIIMNQVITSVETSIRPSTPEQDKVDRSAKEMAALHSMIKRGWSREKIDSEMMMYAKWSEGPQHYRDQQYKKAIEFQNKLFEDRKAKENRFEQLAEAVINSLTKDEENKNLHLKMAEAMALKSRFPERVDNMLVELSEVIMRRIKIYTWVDKKVSEMWIYRDGIYTTNGECVIEQELKDILGELYKKDTVEKIIYHIKPKTYITQEEFNKLALNHEYEINVNNGVLIMDPKTYEVTLIPHSPNKIFLWKLNVDYDPGAECKSIDDFLKQTLSVPSDIEALHEALGTTLQPNRITKKAVICYGEPDTGKSTANNLIHTFLGEANCSNLTLQQITEKDFLISNLFGKIANIAGDLSAEAIKNIDKFKSLTGGDPQECDRKFKISIRFQNQAKLFFSMNKLPRIYNVDKATWNRMMPFKFNRTFIDKTVYDALSEEDKRDKTEEELKAGKLNYGIKDEAILAKITTKEEMSGLLNKAIEGLKRYLRNGGFSYARGVEEVSKDWVRLSDSFMAFCMDEIEAGDPEIDYISRKELANRYGKYCKKHNIKSVGDKSMKNTLSSEFGVYVDGYTFITGTADRCWEGIKWKNKFLKGTL